MATFQLFFSVQGTGGSPTGPDLKTRVGDQDTGSPVSVSRIVLVSAATLSLYAKEFHLEPVTKLCLIVDMRTHLLLFLLWLALHTTYLTYCRRGVILCSHTSVINVSLCVTSL